MIERKPIIFDGGIGALLVLILLAIFPLFGGVFYTELCAKVMLFGIFALSLNVLVGYTGLVSLGHAAYFGVAAYCAVLLAPEYAAGNFWLIFPGAVMLSALSAFVVGVFALRTRGVYFIMVTLAFAQMFYYLFHDTDLGGGSDGIYLNVRPQPLLGDLQLVDFDQPLQLYYSILVLMVVSFALVWKLLRSSFGRALLGIKHNEQRMRTLGFNTYLYKLAAFTLAGALAGVSGYFYVILFGFVSPEFLSWHQSGQVLLMVILGGIGQLTGGFWGALAFVAMQEVFSAWSDHWHLVMGVSIVLAVLFLPGGIAAVPARLRAWANQRRGQ